MGYSSLGGSPEQLRCLANNLRKWGKAYMSCDSADLPAVFENDDNITSTKKKQHDQEENESSVAVAATTLDDTNEHTKDLDWKGWNNQKFGLEMQHPWAGHLLDGRKTIETRAYDLPPSLLGKRIEILETRKGKAG
eukprot:3812301-Ditylum_brightwellii.AAC.1